jgi:hypothetical protein
MTTQLLDFHAFLQYILPLTGGELMAVIQVGRRHNLEGYATFPANALELKAALEALEAEGLLEKRQGRWCWLRKVEAKERSLFA